MTQDEWIAKFADREQAWRDARAAHWATLAGERDAPRAVAQSPVVLDVAAESDIAAGPRRLHDLALSLGWAVRIVAALAADPAKGLIASVTVRFSRHDERGFAAWWNGAYECGWFVSKADGLERLAGTRMRSRKAPKDPDAKMIRGYQDVVEGIRWS